MVPCNYLHNEVSQTQDTVDPECITDPELQFEYLTTSLNMVLFYNTARMHVEKYGNDKIVRESVIQMMQYNPRTPTWSLFPI